MKRSFFSLILVMLCASFVSAESAQVNLRWSKSPGAMRFVFESDKETIRKARVFHSQVLVKVEFQSDFDLSADRKPPDIDVSQKGRNLFMTIKGLKDLKVFRLDGPDRLVLDLIVEELKAPEEGPVEQEAPAELKNRVVVIDPGHGGYNSGLIGDKYKEKDVTLAIAKSLRYSAKEAGASVFLTRWSDKYVSLDERITNTFERGPALFISLHLSSSPDFVIYYSDVDTDVPKADKYTLSFVQRGYVTKSSKLARNMASVIKSKFKRGVRIRKANLPVLSSVGAPAILIELPDGRFFDYDSANRYSLVEALLKGLDL